MFVQLLGRGEDDRQLGQHLYTWFETGQFTVDMDLMYDPLTLLFLLLITGVGSLIHVYSIGYMAHDATPAPVLRLPQPLRRRHADAGHGRQLPRPVPGLGGRRPGVVPPHRLLAAQADSAAAAAKKAFVINRVGDIGLSLGIALMFVTWGSTDFSVISAEAGAPRSTTLTVLGLLLLLGACGKSAQVPLQSWLLDAMEGPTPVSALIHAATMVTAGVYLIVRSNFIFDLRADAQTAVVASPWSRSSGERSSVAPRTTSRRCSPVRR